MKLEITAETSLQLPEFIALSPAVSDGRLGGVANNIKIVATLNAMNYGVERSVNEIRNYRRDLSTAAGVITDGGQWKPKSLQRPLYSCWSSVQIIERASLGGVANHDQNRAIEVSVQRRVYTTSHHVLT
jgi:hypothetical protein